MPHSLSARTRRIAVVARLCALSLLPAAALLLNACGNRGPLYLPDEDPDAITADDAIEASADEDEDDDPRRRSSEDIESDWP